MRTRFIFCLSLLFLNIHFHGMQTPPAKAPAVPKPVVTADIQDTEDENAWFSSLINLISKKVDPLGYATDNKAIGYYHQALAYNPELAQPKKFNLDDISKKVLYKVAPRIIAARKQLLDAVDSKNPDHKAIETLLELYRQVPQVFSECDCAILFGLHNWRRNAHRKSVHELSYYRQTKQSADQSQSVIIDSKESKQELVINAVELRKLAEQKYNWWNPVELIAEGVHYAKKHYTHPIEHLTTIDSMKLCMGIAYFNPLHPFNNADPDFTLKPDLEWHRLLAKKVIDREDIHLVNLIYNILRKRTANAMRLSKPVIATASSNVPSTIFSALTTCLGNAYLDFIQTEKLDSTPVKTEDLDKKRKEETAEEERLALLKKQEAELARKRTEEDERLKQAMLEDEIQRRAHEIARQKVDEELQIRAAAEAEFKATEEKRRAERAASLKALAQSQESSSAASVTPSSVPSSPASLAANMVQSDVPKLDQNPEDLCVCKSGKKYKICCKNNKKTIPSDSPQQP